MDGRQPAPRPLLERGLLAGRDGVPELDDHRGAARAAGVQDGLGAADRVLHLRVVTEPAGAAPRRLLGGQLDQRIDAGPRDARSEEHTSELQSLRHLVCRLLLEKKKNKNHHDDSHDRPDDDGTEHAKCRCHWHHLKPTLTDTPRRLLWRTPPSADPASTPLPRTP